MTLKRSFAPVVDPRTRLLICGSLPGDRSLAAGRYYAHPQNQFWRLTSPVAGVDLTALDYDDRLARLLDARIGLWDVVASASRPGSSDAAIRDHATNDLPALAATLPDLRAIAFNGGTAWRLGTRQMRGVDMYALIPLPSSSPLHTIGVAAKAGGVGGDCDRSLFPAGQRLEHFARPRREGRRDDEAKRERQDGDREDRIRKRRFLGRLDSHTGALASILSKAAMFR